MYVILTRHQCNFCDSARALLTGAGQSFKSYNIQDPESRWLLTLIKQAGHTTVPQIFATDGDYIGGYTELKGHLNVSP